MSSTTRELKFRAWDGGRMHYPEDWRNNDGVFMGMDGLPYQMDDDGACGDPDCCGPASYGMYKYHGGWEWMQATGLKDKHGKDIYEGDIFENHRIRGVVVWREDGYWSVDVVNDRKWVPENETLGAYGQYYEVIGNKFQNPDLLEVSQ